MEKWISILKENHIIEIQDIPHIDLYMDQVTTFMEDSLFCYKRTPDSKILTKTMINNYTKAKIFPPPIKKKYGRTHMMLLIMIFHLKSILSLKDIGTLFAPILSAPSPIEMEQQTEKIYTGFISLQKSILENLKHPESNKELSPDEEMFSHYDEKITSVLMILWPAIRAGIEKQMAEQLLDKFFSV